MVHYGSYNGEGAIMAGKDLSIPPGPKVLKVDILYAGRRLDKFVAHKLPRWSRTLIQKKIRRKEILRNGAGAKPNDFVQQGDIVSINADVPEIDISSIHLKFLYEDEDFVAVEKMPGVIVHPAGKETFGTIINALHYHYKISGQNSVTPLLCHRLDRDTSGVLLVAKNISSRRFIQNEFESGRVRKEYLAIVEGNVKQENGVIEKTLRKVDSSPDRMPRMEVHSSCGQHSVTGFVVIKRYNPIENILNAGATLLAALPRTGRTHQIRAHLAYLGHPVLCDKVYGNMRALNKGEETVLARQALHSHKITFNHPSGGERTVISQLPSDMSGAVEMLSRDSL